MTGAGETPEQTKIAFLFPGQGAMDAAALELMPQHGDFAQFYEPLCDAAHLDLIAELQRGPPSRLNENRFSSSLTVLASALALSRVENLPAMSAGYSVGQWTALYAANALECHDLFRVVWRRAELMDASLQHGKCGMAAVIGLPFATVENTLAELRDAGHPVYVSNANCNGHYTICGTLTALELAEAALHKHHPKQVTRLSMSGAWHSPLLEGAMAGFRTFLQSVPLAPPRLPVIDNTTGDFLSNEPEALREALTGHLTRPVLWHKGIEALVASGCREFWEIGYGNILSRFGFFIHRRSRFIAIPLTGPDHHA